MTFEDAIKLIRDGKFTHLKIVDTDNKKLMDLHSDNSEDLISQLESYKSILQANGRLKFLAATDTIFKQNWKDCFTWNIVFTNSAPATNTAQNSIGGIPSGYVSANEANLLAELKALQMQRDFDNKLAEINKKLDEKESAGFEKYLPMLGLFADIKPEKLNTMMALSGMQAAMNGNNVQGLAGLQEKKAEVQTTVEEKELINSINQEMGKLSEKIELSKINEFVKTLNNKPEFFNVLMSMAAAHK